VNLIHGLRIDPELEEGIQVTVIATGFPRTDYEEIKSAGPVKTTDSDFLAHNEFEKMFERIKRPEYLPQREYQDDLDVPSVIRKYSYQAEEKLMETAEKL
jgi:cell division GTPase FtsZ